MQSRTHRALAALFVALSLSAPLASIASSVRPVDFNHIVDHAAAAFQGRCVETHSERDAATGVIVTYTTFEITDALKGDLGTTYTIKQVGGKMGDEVYRVDGIPSFTPNEEYVVFLYGKSAAGFSSPVGLSQGRFFVRPEPVGASVENGRDFREMLPADAPGLSVSSSAKLKSAPGQVMHLDLDEFKRLVRARAPR